MSNQQLKNITAKEVIAAFEKAKFVADRQKGSHVVLVKEGHPLHLSVPNHGNKALGPGLIKSLIRASGLSKGDFLKKLRS